MSHPRDSNPTSTSEINRKWRPHYTPRHAKPELEIPVQLIFHLRQGPSQDELLWQSPAAKAKLEHSLD
eukprot:scaffold7863_cov76-Amphora_coffeaeformis.AAC.1